jgi:hypothetical protein
LAVQAGDGTVMKRLAVVIVIYRHQKITFGRRGPNDFIITAKNGWRRLLKSLASPKKTE